MTPRLRATLSHEGRVLCQSRQPMHKAKDGAGHICVSKSYITELRDVEARGQIVPPVRAHPILAWESELPRCDSPVVPASDDLALMNEHRPDRNAPRQARLPPRQLRRPCMRPLSAYLGREAMLLAMMRSVEDLRALEELKSPVACVGYAPWFRWRPFLGSHRLEIANDLEVLIQNLL